MNGSQEHIRMFPFKFLKAGNNFWSAKIKSTIPSKSVVQFYLHRWQAVSPCGWCQPSLHENGRKWPKFDQLQNHKSLIIRPKIYARSASDVILRPNPQFPLRSTSLAQQRNLSLFQQQWLDRNFLRLAEKCSWFKYPIDSSIHNKRNNNIWTGHMIWWINLMIKFLIKFNTKLIIIGCSYDRRRRCRIG